MPDTPGLSALRVGVSELGAGPVLVNLARQVLQPADIACAIASCLNPAYEALYQSLSDLVTAGPQLLHPAGDDQHNPEAFMEAWLSSIRTLGSGLPTGL
jgi:hypothetical protein